MHGDYDSSHTAHEHTACTNAALYINKRTNDLELKNFERHKQTRIAIAMGHGHG
jgi:hypothetical protein